ncbi:hypothetical protein JAAARDRAFT_196096 [Jaapia argillacea MUCL 33604]|uniref:Uncharacterized protein n=1 Tax=Jaapia argillacea MUCL 33604 TaxID=933084 RepID=A0A067PY32_9AGAM|nr:hypothetical protein JAAARDRAFT_196096 [Jaapia argillacea MUCL 33604]
MGRQTHSQKKKTNAILEEASASIVAPTTQKKRGWKLKAAATTPGPPAEDGKVHNCEQDPTQGPAAGDPQDDSSTPIPPLSIAPPRPYSTRPSNNPHPRTTAGIKKQRMADISAEAERKRQEKDKLAERRKLEIEERRKEVEAKMRVLAKLENDYARDHDDIEPVGNGAVGGTSDVVDRPSVAGVGDVGAQQEQLAADPKQPARGKTTKSDQNPKARKTKKDEREESHLVMDALRKEVAKWKAAPAESEKPTKKGKTVLPSLPMTWKQNVHPLLAKSAAGSRTDSHETIGGFNDNDLVFNRKAAIMLPHKHHNMVEILSGTEDADLNSLSPVETEVPEQKHRAKTSVPEEDSKSVETLPSWVKNDWWTTVKPTLCELMGQFPNPWNINGDAFLKLLHEAFNLVYPELQINLEDEEDGLKIILVAKQGQANWRRGFLRATTTTVKAALQKYTNPTAVKKYVASASKVKSGAAFWGEPGSDNPKNPKAPTNALHTEFIFKTLAYHLTSTQGLAFIASEDELELAYPRGAIAMSAAASTSNYKKPTRPFGGPEITKATDSWSKNAVMRLCDKSHQFNKFLGRAYSYVSLLSPQLDDDNRALIFDPSSPPVENQDLQMDVNCEEDGNCKDNGEDGEDEGLNYDG